MLGLKLPRFLLIMFELECSCEIRVDGSDDLVGKTEES